ncbi:MAG: 50S ribosomal protein L28 [Mycoplasmataceae bacterium]|jgi:large subunit ribosomal protein L28|nr:50S ribosomal protein L28 [Mycoplasmataceae bacterium]
MSKKDQITGKKAMCGNTRSFSMNHSRRKWDLNLQTVTIKDGKGKTRKVRVAARTLKTLKRDNKVAPKVAK